MKCVAPLCAPTCFHHNASLYGVKPPSQKCADWPSIEGELTNCVIENDATLPLPPAPAHTVQFCQPVIWSMLLIAVPTVGAGAGAGADVVPLTLMLRASL